MIRFFFVSLLTVACTASERAPEAAVLDAGTVHDCPEKAVACFGDSAAQCSNGRWDEIDVCQFGCLRGECREQCPTVGRRQCSTRDGTDVVESCTNTFRWRSLGPCPYGCRGGPDAGLGAECVDPICDALDTRCSVPDGGTRERCNAIGSMWEPDPCPPVEGQQWVCARSSCRQVICPPGEMGCYFGDLGQCRHDGTLWDVKEDCLYGCETALDGGSACRR